MTRRAGRAAEGGAVRWMPNGPTGASAPVPRVQARPAPAPAVSGPPALALLVLAKAPEPGRVKTRLCPPLTPEQAADVAAAALLDTLAAVGAVPGARAVVALAGRLSRASGAGAVAAALRDALVVRQRGPGLGARIAAAHRATATLLPGRPVLQLGMDTPQVDPALLAESAARLHRDAVDAVVGPASDGGWWALGLRDPRAARVIAGVPTSRDDTGERTVHALRAAGLRVALLPELTDVDMMADAVAVARTAPGTRFATAVGEVAAACCRIDGLELTDSRHSSVPWQCARVALGVQDDAELPPPTRGEGGPGGCRKGDFVLTNARTRAVGGAR